MGMAFSIPNTSIYTVAKRTVGLTPRHISVIIIAGYMGITLLGYVINLLYVRLGPRVVMWCIFAIAVGGLLSSIHLMVAFRHLGQAIAPSEVGPGQDVHASGVDREEAPLLAAEEFGLESGDDDSD